jgi:hypothetical protein
MLQGRIQSAVTFSSTGVPDDTGSTDLVTLAAVKDYLTVTDTSEDVFLSAAISVASQALETFLDRIIVKRRVVERFRRTPSNIAPVGLSINHIGWNGYSGASPLVNYGSLGGPLVLTHNPVIGIVSIVDGIGSTVPASDYISMSKAGTVMAADSTRIDLFAGDYTVSYDCGWPIASLPAALKHGTMEWVKTLRMDRFKDPSVAREQTVDVGLVEYTWGVSRAATAQALGTGDHGGVAPVSVAALVNSYKRKFS